MIPPEEFENSITILDTKKISKMKYSVASFWFSKISVSSVSTLIISTLSYFLTLGGPTMA
jgi:hypothetical protein